MRTLDSSMLLRCAQALDQALLLLQQSASDSVEYELYRTACLKEFQTVTEQTGKLLRKALRAYFVSHRQADELGYKDAFRAAARHGLLSTLEAERWLCYYDNLNTTHNYEAGFTEATLELMPQFIADATVLADTLHGQAID